MTLDPYHSDNMLLSKTALGGLLVVLFAAISMKDS